MNLGPPQDRLRVLHVYRTYFPDPPGGIQEAIRQICLSTRPFGVDSTVYCLSPQPDPPQLARPEAAVSRRRSWAAPGSCDLGGPAAFSAFAGLARRHDVLHYHFPWPFEDVLHGLVRPSTPAVMTYHSDIVRQRLLNRLYRPLMWRTLPAMKAIVATSPAYARTSPVLTDARIAGRVRVIPLGIGEGTVPMQEDAAIFGRLGLVPGRAFFLFVGALRYYKGLRTLIEAAGRVDADIVVAGEGPEGAALRRRAQGAANIRFAGAVSHAEKIALMRRAAAFVLPSHRRSEAFGMVLVEAAMLGLPMVSCEIGTGTSFVNEDGSTGFVVAPEDAGALSVALNRLLRDPALARRLGEGARRRYEALFSGAALGRAHAALYREAAGLGVPASAR